MLDNYLLKLNKLQFLQLYMIFPKSEPADSSRSGIDFIVVQRASDSGTSEPKLQTLCKFTKLFSNENFGEVQKNEKKLPQVP